jgi:hypothetical protein
MEIFACANAVGVRIKKASQRRRIAASGKPVDRESLGFIEHA